MKRLVPDILEALRRGERVVLAVVLDSCGSTPRKAGSVLAVFADGTSLGTVGGGAIEFESQRVCGLMHESKSPVSQTQGYSLAETGTGDLCMICGGDVTVHFRVVEPTEDMVAMFAEAATEPVPERKRWIVFDTFSEEQSKIFLTDRENSDLAYVLRSKAYYDKDVSKCLALPIGRGGRVYVFGGGHVGREIVPVLARLGFACVVYDDREDFAREESFPEAERVICGNFKRIDENVTLTSEDYVIVVTRGHANDYEVLAQTLQSEARYVGCMGSRRKMAIIREKLREEAGLSAEAVERLVSPIGLEIDAETPEELAVSIAAELIRFRASL